MDGAETIEEPLSSGPGAGHELDKSLRHSAVLASLAPAAVHGPPRVAALGYSHGPMTGGVYRVAYSLGQGSPRASWSIILKIVSPAAFSPAEREAMESPLYWQREALAYRSGLLDNLPGGLRAPRLMGMEERPDGSLWLWQEEVRDTYGPRWPLDQYRRAARCLGRFNGAYLSGHPLPDYPWLVRTGSPRGLLEAHVGLRDLAIRPSTWESPALKACASAGIAERLRRLWDERAPLLDLLEHRLPRTLCHHDAWRANLFAPRERDAPDEIVAIDWAYLGYSAVGTDPGDLFAPSFAHGLVEPCTPRELDEAVFGSYLEGLREAGWQGEQAEARLGYAAFAALKYGAVLPWLVGSAEAGSVDAWLHGQGRPVEELLHEPGMLLSYLLDLLDEARDLAASL